MNNELVSMIRNNGMNPMEVVYKVRARNGRFVEMRDVMAREVWPEIREGGTFDAMYHGRKVMGHVVSVVAV